MLLQIRSSRSRRSSRDHRADNLPVGPWVGSAARLRRGTGFLVVSSREDQDEKSQSTKNKAKALPFTSSALVCSDRRQQAKGRLRMRTQRRFED